jgi:ABC-type branched-subunit amino acid transport system ATPase component
MNMDAVPFLTVREIVMDFGGIRALDKMSLDLSRGDVKCIIGPNGCGKSTLFKVISGDLDPTSGQVCFMGEDTTGLSPQKICRKGIARKFQIPSVFDELTVAENIEIAITAATKHYAPFSLLRGGPDRSSYELILAETGLLEYGNKLASEAGMTEEETDAIVHMIQDVRDRLGVAVLVIEHDMSFVRKLGSPIIVMMKGAILREGEYAAISQDPEIRQAYLGDIE